MASHGSRISSPAILTSSARANGSTTVGSENNYGLISADCMINSLRIFRVIVPLACPYLFVPMHSYSPSSAAVTSLKINLPTPYGFAGMTVLLEPAIIGASHLISTLGLAKNLHSRVTFFPATASTSSNPGSISNWGLKAEKLTN